MNSESPLTANSLPKRRSLRSLLARALTGRQEDPHPEGGRVYHIRSPLTPLGMFQSMGRNVIRANNWLKKFDKPREKFPNAIESGKSANLGGQAGKTDAISKDPVSGKTDISRPQDYRDATTSLRAAVTPEAKPALSTEKGAQARKAMIASRIAQGPSSLGR